MRFEYKYTVFTPAYNRAATLPRLLRSLERQSFRNFEYIVVDDGSTDDTLAVLNRMKLEVSFPLRIIAQKNQGKHIARNRALDEARGEFFFTVDSDDTLLPNALRVCLDAWEAIPAEGRKRFAGVEGLCVRIGTGETIGSVFPCSPWDADHIHSRYAAGISGDKTRFVRTEVFREHKYAEVEGERFLAESFAWDAIGLKYKTRYINEPLVEVDYQPGGITANSRMVRARNPKGAILYYSQLLGRVCETRMVRRGVVIRAAANLVRYRIHARRYFDGHGLGAIGLLAVPLGVALWFLDSVRQNARRQ